MDSLVPLLVAQKIFSLNLLRSKSIWYKTIKEQIQKGLGVTGSKCSRPSRATEKLQIGVSE